MSAADDRARLTRALARHRDIEDWTVRLTTTRAVWRSWGADEARGSSERAALVGELHRDQPHGRGSATIELAADGDAERAVADAIVRADGAIGPIWRTPSPAAPARVALADPAIDPAAPRAALDAIVADAIAAAASAALAIERGWAELAIDDVELTSRRGQRARWRATRLELHAEVGAAGVAGGPTAPIACRARRGAELDLAGALALAGRRLADRDAPPPPPGPYPVALRARALAHGGTGLLDAIVAQADPALDRQGLVRYHLGKPIADGATLSLESDGARPFGWRSAPLGEHGEPVRRFALVAGGIATGLGLDAREAALRGAQPNGGVRGLVVPPGELAADALITAGTLVIDALAWLEIERTTGWFRAAIAAGEVAGPTPRRIRGGMLRGDAIGLLGRARRSVELVETPELRAPALWHLGELEVE